MDIIVASSIFQLPDYLYEVNILSVTLRLVMAVIIGGIIGLERGTNSHPAGFRTHILVCVGATMAMLTDQYICQFLSATADPARLGAQVITGVGFLGVGTIFATGKRRIRGLTTAAGLWASACLGLAVGIGFYSGAVIGGIMIYVSLAVLPHVEKYFYGNTRHYNLYIEVSDVTMLRSFKAHLNELDISILETQVSASGPVVSKGVGFHLYIRLPKNLKYDSIKSVVPFCNLSNRICNLVYEICINPILNFF